MVVSGSVQRAYTRGVALHIVEVRRRQGAGRLPAPTHSFVGRDRELEKINTLLLGSARLITLTGRGGIGKTRLAAEAVRRYHKADTRKIRVYWVRLARLTPGSDTTAVAEEIAHTVIDADFSGRSVWDALLDTLTRPDPTGHTPRTILVLDNCEHLLTAVVDLITELLETIPKLTVVTTSREPLCWVDEHLIPVPPLSRRNGVALFRQRAELTGHPVIGTEQAATAAEICRHINNHPLYIQLAAARLVHQPLAMILSGLTGDVDDTRLRWSHGPRAGADPRHRGVADVIAWSYQLCGDSERLLFDRLSVFAAGYDTNPDDTTNTVLDVGADLDAIETICSDDTDDANNHAGVSLARGEIENVLECLANHSLVSVHITPTTVRYSLVESLRVFAQYQLRQRSTPEMDAPARLADRHLRYYRDKITYAATHWFHPEGQDLLSWALGAWADLVTAIETSLTIPGEAGAGLEICLGLISLRVPYISGSVREIRSWMQRCLDATWASTPRPTELQIEAMAHVALAAMAQGLLEDAERMLEECITVCIPDPDLRAHWRHTAETDLGLPAVAEYAWGMELLFARGDACAITVLTRARDKFDALGHPGAASLSELFTAVAASILGTAYQAHEITQRCLDRANASGILWEKLWAQLIRAIALARHGDPTEALALLRTVLAQLLPLHDQWAGWWAVEFRSWSLAYLITDSRPAGKLDHNKLVAVATEIAHLAGGVKTLRAHLGIDIGAIRPFADESAKAITVARRVLGSDAFTAAETRGARLRPELGEVQRFAMGTHHIDTPPTSSLAKKVPLSRWHDLTKAEQQVAILAAAGWTNTAISARRGTSVRTIDTQIAAILHKLVITSREDIIEHIPRSAIDQVRTETTRRPDRTGQNPLHRLP
ncbi:AAA family ATPase [Nocardia sp. NPDC049190]|uniref:AAA family ATPase n=1 Tax=Nocardia sp. NPDC049190 TaxID=3155650 RepID=UPI0033CE46DE